MSASGFVIVTGGTGELGAAVVHALLDRGERVAVPYRHRSGWDQLVARSDAGDRLWGAEADMADDAGAEQFVAAAGAALGALGGVAAVAGAYAGSGPFEQAPAGEWSAMWRANLETTRATCRAALPRLLAGGGSVVTVSSRLAERPAGGATAYAVSKAAVLALTRTLAAENAARGVRFNCVVPGTIDTAANRRAMPGADPSTWTRPESIARVIVYLLSPEAAAVTGACVPVDQAG